MSDSIAGSLILRVALHARSAARIVELAREFPESAITITAGASASDARSILGLLGLGAGTGTEVTIQATGVDAEGAVSAIVAFLEEDSPVGDLPALVPFRLDSVADGGEEAGSREVDRVVVLELNLQQLRVVPGVGPIVLTLIDPDEKATGVSMAELVRIANLPGLRVALSGPHRDRWQALRGALNLTTGSEVLVHEPDRPSFDPVALARLIEQSGARPVRVGATPVHSTVKVANGWTVISTVPRETLSELQPPWIFAREALVAALQTAIAARWPADSEVDLVRGAGLPVDVLPGDTRSVHAGIGIGSGP